MRPLCVSARSLGSPNVVRKEAAMRRFTVTCFSLFVGTLAALAFDLGVANAQNVPMTNQTRQTLGFYGGWQR